MSERTVWIVWVGTYERFVDSVHASREGARRAVRAYNEAKGLSIEEYDAAWMTEMEVLP